MGSSAQADGRLVCVADFEKDAGNNLPSNNLEYYKSGADDEFTLFLNKDSFKRWRIRPRVLRDVSVRSLRARALGADLALPLGVSPTAMQGMAHPLGECACAKAVEDIGGVYILGTLATSSIEEVAEAAPNAVKWFQLFIYKDRSVTAQLARRAEAAGYQALVLTVDVPVLGFRRTDARNKFRLPENMGLANFDPRRSNGKDVSNATAGLRIEKHVTHMFNPDATWEDVKWLKQLTKLPVVLKGIMTKEDALLGVEAGVDAIFVSNHGARQLDSVPSTIEALSEIAPAVRGRCEVYVDGGFNKGTDIFKALALGANMVFVGRAALWGLAHSGQAGVGRVLEILRKELDTTMALAGCTTPKEIVRDMVVHENFFCHM